MKNLPFERRTSARARLLRAALIAPLGGALLAIGATTGNSGLGSPATAQTQAAVRLPGPPADGVMGFVVWHFVPPVIQGKDACPDGPALKNREIFLNSLSAEERERLQKKENEREFTQRWRASLMSPDGRNMCTHSAHFPDRPTIRTVQSKFAWGLDLDGDAGGGPMDQDTCEHETFTTPDGEKGIDNQTYRALGCKLEWRGVDGVQGDIVQGFQNLMASGEWTQVILLRGVDSLVNDDHVEIVYGNTSDRPIVDSAGKFVWHVSFTVNDRDGRYRNVMRGHIVNGVLTTDRQDIKLSRGAASPRRNPFDMRRSRLRLMFQPDGSLKGILGAYQPINYGGSIGGLGTAMTAGIDCAGDHNTIVKHADGMRDPKTGKCTAVSTAMELFAVPAFVNDLPAKQKIASK